MYEMTILLSCKHINYVYIESKVDAPSVGDRQKCTRCQQVGNVVKVGTPYRMGDTAPNPAIKK